MTPRDVFGIVIRSCGLFVTSYAIWFLAYGVAHLIGLPEDWPNAMRQYFISGGLMVLVGIYLLRGAPFLLWFSYPLVKPRRENETEQPGR